MACQYSPAMTTLMGRAVEVAGLQRDGTFQILFSGVFSRKIQRGSFFIDKGHSFRGALYTYVQKIMSAKKRLSDYLR